jgi:hypothetical protein
VCQAADCQEPSTLSWERHATFEEGTALITSGDLPAGIDLDVLRLPVDACDNHRVNRTLAGHVHAADCTAPPATPIVFGEPDPDIPRSVAPDLSGGECGCAVDPIVEEPA